VRTGYVVMQCDCACAPNILVDCDTDGYEQDLVRICLACGYQEDLK
jgi:hypothetical protein